jgi:hypothetical protein
MQLKAQDGIAEATESQADCAETMVTSPRAMAELVNFILAVEGMCD